MNKRHPAGLGWHVALRQVNGAAVVVAGYALIFACAAAGALLGGFLDRLVH